MSRKYRKWSSEESRLLGDLYDAGAKVPELMRRFDRGSGSITNAIQRHRAEIDAEYANVMIPSPYPRFDDPLVYTGDRCLVLPDPEFPFQHSAWINKVLKLARAWNVKHCIVAGDMLHAHSLSLFDPAWADGKAADLVGINLAIELQVAKQQIKRMHQQFDSLDFILGNHEGRIIRALGSVITPEFISRLLDLDQKKWRTAPYYFMHVVSQDEPFLIEHPKTSAKGAPAQLADKYQAHVLMAHSHKTGMAPSRSGRWMGWHIGCCVDENRLAYAAQRHNGGDPHKLGAAFIMDGSVYPLFEGWTDFKAMERMFQA